MERKIFYNRKSGSVQFVKAVKKDAILHGNCKETEKNHLDTRTSGFSKCVIEKDFSAFIRCYSFGKEYMLQMCFSMTFELVEEINILMSVLQKMMF